MNYRLLLSSFLLGITLIANAQEQWTQQTSGTTQSLNSVYCPDSNHCFAAGNVGLKTTNGGNTWTSSNFGGYGVYCLDTNRCFAVSGGVGNISKTTNGGTTWNNQIFGSNALYSVYFLDSNTGWVVGEQGAIIKTTNGGATWFAQTSGTTHLLLSVHFPNASTGYSVGQGGVILKTINGGTTWTALDTGSNSKPYLRNVHFFDANTGYINASGAIYITSNGGASWSQHAITSTWGMYSLFCFDTNTCYSVSFTSPVNEGQILKITNGATNTVVQLQSEGLASVYFPSTSIGYAVGIDGAIYKHTGLPVPILASKPSGKSFGFSNGILGYNLSQPSNVQILLFDLKGRQSLRLVDGIEQAGDHILMLPVNGAAGIQILDFRADGEHRVVKMVGE